MKFITLITFIFLISCNHQMDKNNKHIKIIGKKELSNKKKVGIHKINCFQKNDSLKILSILDRFKVGCKNKESISYLLSKNYINEFEKFPCELFENALKNDAIPDFKIENQSKECNTLAVYFNYITKMIDGNEEHRSESTLILYLIKDENGDIFLESIGAAG